LLADLQSGVDLSGMFNQDELDALLDGLIEKESMQPAEAQTDKAAELQKLWNTQPGQLWALGRHRLIVGDCTDKATVERLMQGEKAVLMLTDPPYGVDVAGGTHDPRDEKNYRSGGIVENDALTDAELEALLDSAFKIARSVMDKGAAYYVWHPSSKVELFARSIRVNLAPHREIIIWFKDNFVFGRQDYHWQHEPCFYGWIEGAHKWYGDRTQSTVWIVEKVGTDLEKKLHPTAKPIGLPEKALNNHTATSDIVYEPFCGSGTTLIACEQLNRQCRAIEISPAYCAVILQRYQDSTGQTPVLL
jgi:DNA modification methylase